ncbi:MAG TPA: amidohydrolase family protein [Hyphomonadaceae bacterium]|jgi:cytosine/adenosine deaminase-related metal-dependent hydrolase|nr:amidohydrolase family protein [Hyphomonadaceae bacterium]
MDPTSKVIPDGIVWVEGVRIKAVSPAAAPPPPKFVAGDIVNTAGTIYPGLIELHNHLSYNCLKTWKVPQLYTNRDRWGSHPDYRKLISGPTKVLGSTEGLPAALVRYVEAKCLLSGVTTSQGITLQSIRLERFYKGVIRNVEVKTMAELPAAKAKISDVEATDASKFLARLRRDRCVILHLAEGKDPGARSHFTDLKLPDGAWALAPSLVGIHCAALESADFKVMAKFGASMVWSPLSNLLLYGGTADIKAAKAAGVRIALGSDWSPSGSKNLLAELKVAKAVSDNGGGIFSDREIVAMATTSPAAMLSWGENLGSLEAEKIADLIVVDGTAEDPYLQLIEASEADLALVMIGGVRRLARTNLMDGAANPEPWTVDGKKKVLNLQDADSDPLVSGLTLAAAVKKLKDGLADLPKLAKDLEKPKPAGLRKKDFVTLKLDHEEPSGEAIRPRFATAKVKPLRLAPVVALAAAPPLSQILQPMTLDAITVADDATYVSLLKQQSNIPQAIRNAL